MSQYKADYSLGYVHHEIEIKGFIPIMHGMVVWISEHGRVGQHQGRIPIIPERGMVTKPCLWNQVT